MQRGGLSTQHPLSSRIPTRSGGGSAGMWPEPEGTSVWPQSPVSPRDGPIWRGLGSHANHITGHRCVPSCPAATGWLPAPSGVVPAPAPLCGAPWLALPAPAKCAPSSLYSNFISR